MSNIKYLKLAATLLVVGFFSFNLAVGQNIHPKDGLKYPNADIEKQRSATKNFIVPIEQYNGFAGTYGELRGNHFHCGLDMRTGGVEGKKIYAADDGYVCRISISAWGFGNMIMIAHPSGYKTIYGHLQRFAPKYQKIVRERQYREKQWNLEFDFEPDEYPVKRGDLIAFSGNTGSSGGPHLHFEVRDEEGVPVNLQLSNTYDLKDLQKPLLRDIQFVGAVPLGEAYYTFPLPKPEPKTTYTTKKVVKKNKKGVKYTVNQKVAVKSNPENEIIDVPQGFYVAIDAYDAMDANSGKLAIYKYDVFVDDELFFSFEEGNIPYTTGRYIASLLDHRLRLEKGRYYVKTLLGPGNQLSDRIFARKGGLCTLRDTLVHSVKVVVYDVCMNSQSKSFKVRLNNDKFSSQIPASASGSLMRWDEKNLCSGERFNLSVPEGALYSNSYFTSAYPLQKGRYKEVWRIGDKNIPLHRSATLELKCEIPDSLSSRAVIARLSDKGALSSCGGRYNPITKSIIAQIGSFGNYVVAFDTIAPKATFKFQRGAKITSKSVAVVIGDNLSGVEDFSVWIDGHWVVAEYDGKSSTLNIPLDDARISHGKSHAIEVQLIDGVGNRTVESSRFIW